RPRSRSMPPTSSARSAEPGCRPWSTVTPPAAIPRRGASNATAAASANESAPPLQATSTACGGSVCPASARRTATRTWATAGSGPLTGLLAALAGHVREDCCAYLSAPRAHRPRERALLAALVGRVREGCCAYLFVRCAHRPRERALLAALVGRVREG